MKFLEEAKRPWGKYQKFYQENGVWVKRVEVKPDGRLSLQKHQHRSEKWVFVAGEGIAIVDGQQMTVGPGSVVDIPLGAVHRIGNTGKELLIFIEVATGAILTEEDIIRLEDDYNRPPGFRQA